MLSGIEVAKVISKFGLGERLDIAKEHAVTSSRDNLAHTVPEERSTSLLATGLFILSRIIVSFSVESSSGNQLLRELSKIRALGSIHSAISTAGAYQAEPSTLFRLFANAVKMQLGNLEFSIGQDRQATLLYEACLPSLEEQALQEEGYMLGKKYGAEAIRPANDNWPKCRERIANESDGNGEGNPSTRKDLSTEDAVKPSSATSSEAAETSRKLATRAPVQKYQVHLFHLK
jgi:hypothetical protein